MASAHGTPIELWDTTAVRLLPAGEAKWSDPLRIGADRPAPKAVVHVPGYDPDRTRLAICSRSGFTDGFRRRADAEAIILRSAEDLYA